MVEICDNGIDDDGNGLIDLNDPNCECTITKPESLIPNPSFEDFSVCPLYAGQLNFAKSWYQASLPTTDYINLCGWNGFPEFPLPLPLPDGQGAVGIRDGRYMTPDNPQLQWKEYAGVCLKKPMIPSYIYRFEFFVGFVNDLKSPPIEITFFGAFDCGRLPFGQHDENLGCPTNDIGWKKLNATLVRSNGPSTWVKAYIEFRPTETLWAIAIGPACPVSSTLVSTYYFFDNLILADQEQFKTTITEVGHRCSPDYMLTVPELENHEYQWYKEGIALVGETSYNLSNLKGEGNYQVRAIDGFVCSLSEPFEYIIPTIFDTVDAVACEKSGLIFGNQTLNKAGEYMHTFISANGCDSTVILNLTIEEATYDTLNAKIFAGETFQLGGSKFSEIGTYDAILTSSIGCDSLVHLNLDHFKVFFPNIFSPNEDGFNDHFSVISPDANLFNTELIIYDRWGSVVYKGPSWDGKYNNETVMSGVYGYVAKLNFRDGGSRVMKGSVTVIH